MTLAAISSSFKANLKQELKRTLRVKRKKLESAFNMIKSRVSKSGDLICTAIPYESFSKLMKIIDPDKSDLKIKILFQVLDFSDDNCLRRQLQIFLEKIFLTYV